MDQRQAIESFLKWLHAATEHPVEFRALVADRSKGPKGVFTRDLDVILAHIGRFPDRDHYYGVATRLKGAGQGKREHLAELPALWVDCDTKKLGIDQAVVIQAFRTCPCPPSGIIATGGGLHGIWRLREPVDLTSPEHDDELIAINHQLIEIFAGDEQVFDLPRILRLPGTPNLKYEGHPICEAIELNDRTYEVADLAEWCSEQRILVSRPAGTSLTARPMPADDPFSVYALRAGYRPPVDVQATLDGMKVGNLNQGIVLVSAKLVQEGKEDQEILDLLLAKVESACLAAGRTMNRRGETRKIMGAIKGARAKGYDKPRHPPPKPKVVPTVVHEATTGAPVAAPVIDIQTERDKRKATKPDPEEEKKRIELVGAAALDWWRDKRGPLMTADGEFWTYAGGFWTRFGASEEHALRVAIQGVVRTMKFNPESRLLNGAYRWIQEDPDLAHYNVAWNRSGLVICRNGALDVLTGAVQPHSPDHFATYRIEVDIDPEARCPAWDAFWARALSGLTEEDRIRCVETIAEWFGAALVRGKPREQAKALIAYGPSRTGKTQVAMVARHLVGGRTSGIRARSLLDRFAFEPLLDATAWIADDAVSSGEYLDAEVFKVLVTGEPTSVERKGKTNVEHAFDIPILLTANHLPKVKDQSDAVYNRALILPMTEPFPETSAAARPLYETFLGELAGILNWAVSGYQRLAARRFYAPPPVMTKALDDFQADNNPIGKWMDEAVIAAPSLMVDRRDIVASFQGFCALEFGAEYKAPGARSIIPAIRQRMPHVEDFKTEGARFLTGMKLTDEGIEYVENLQKVRGTAGVGSGETGKTMNRLRPAASAKDPRAPRF